MYCNLLRVPTLPLVFPLCVSQSCLFRVPTVRFSELLVASALGVPKSAPSYDSARRRSVMFVGRSRVGVNHLRGGVDCLWSLWRL